MKRVVATALKFGAFFVGWAVLSGVIDVPSSNPAVWRFFAEVVPFAVLIGFTAVFLATERGEVTIPVRDDAGRGLLVGTFVGCVWIGLPTVILLTGHHLEVVGAKTVSSLWLWMVSAFVNVVMQELLVRGYLYQLLKVRYGLSMAVLFTTVLFTLLHGGAIEAGALAVANVVTMCLFTTALYESERTILAPIAAHAIWNVIGAIVLGVVSLADDYPSVLSMAASGPALLSGGAYQIEASVVVTIINVALLLLFLLRARRNART